VTGRPLLICDSGVGGLSVLGAIRALLPTAPLAYAADSAGYPYGTKRAAEIEARVPALLGRLAERYGVTLAFEPWENRGDGLALAGVCWR
jgi:glutamate racemase